MSYNAAMVAHVRRDSPSDALDLFEEMRAVGHEPTAISFNVAIACVRAGRGARAWSCSTKWWRRAWILMR